MSQAARQREAERATLAYQIVVAKLGVQTLADSILQWDDLPQNARPTQVQSWLNGAVQLTMTRRSLAVRIARSFYRLVRALRTGYTIADPTTPEPKFVTLQKLRSDFSTVVESRLDANARTYIDRLLPAEPPSNDGGEQIQVEEIDTLGAQEKADEKRAEQQLRENISNLGPAYRDKLAGQVDTSKPADQADKERQKAHDRAGARQAASGAREAMNGARSHVWAAMERDKRAIGYIRVSLTGTPCGWCAMLISRGAVYKSKASAEFSDGDKYHDNCHCVAVQVYSQDEYKTSPLFALNREYQALWPEVTRGQVDPLAAWRRYIRQHPKQPQAQVASGAPTNAQEA